MDTLTPLICDLLEWLERAPRTHAEVIDGWRTSCPRLPVWEEATDRSYVARRGRFVEVTGGGRCFLAQQRHVADPPDPTIPAAPEARIRTS
jgi:hypothetical protein